MLERHQDWLRQAHLDLDHARLAAREGHLEWAVFAAQQAAEKGCKAVHLWLGGDAWGHDLPRDHYTPREAEQAIADAEAILVFCARSISG